MSNVKIVAQYLKNFSLNAPNSPAVFLNPHDKPNIAVSIDLDAKKISDGHFEVTLKIKADAKSKEEKLFDFDVSYAGLFALEKIEGEMLEQVLLIYCPNLLFPFLRRIITNASTDAGFAPLMLDPIDFALLFAKRKTAENAVPASDSKN